jgi:hypothetical protein
MTAIYNFLQQMTIRLGQRLSLIFFVLFFVQGCKEQETGKVRIVWSGSQATGVTIPLSFLPSSSDASLKSDLQIRLEKSNVAMLGEYKTVGEQIIFNPLIPLSPGKKYQLFYRENLISELAVPVPDEGGAPSLISVYPSADTLPENLLKIYLQFSAPMREGEALQHIHLLDDGGDTVPNIFLDLQPELWNKERTALTVWLDPGRIKRDLIPNRQLGNPLKKAKRYSLNIDGRWKDAQGLPLKQSYTKGFIVSTRDGTSPQPEKWVINIPVAETTGPLHLYFKEPLDYFLLMETIQVVNEKGDLVRGRFQIIDKEKGAEFTPEERWKAGKYRLRIASYLEDLAGNNLNRPFDRDTKLEQKKEGDFVEREIIIRGQ